MTGVDFDAQLESVALRGVLADIGMRLSRLGYIYIAIAGQKPFAVSGDRLDGTDTVTMSKQLLSALVEKHWLLPQPSSSINPLFKLAPGLIQEAQGLAEERKRP